MTYNNNNNNNHHHLTNEGVADNGNRRLLVTPDRKKKATTKYGDDVQAELGWDRNHIFLNVEEIYRDKYETRHNVDSSKGQSSDFLRLVSYQDYQQYWKLATPQEVGAARLKMLAVVLKVPRVEMYGIENEFETASCGYEFDLSTLATLAGYSNGNSNDASGRCGCVQWSVGGRPDPFQVPKVTYSQLRDRFSKMMAASYIRIVGSFDDERGSGSESVVTKIPFGVKQCDVQKAVDPTFHPDERYYDIDTVKYAWKDWKRRHGFPVDPTW